jgi:hypothetical protein
MEFLQVPEHWLLLLLLFFFFFSSSYLGSTALSYALASSTISFQLSLSNAYPTGRRWNFNPAEFLEASRHFRFYRVGLLAPRPTPTLEDPAPLGILYTVVCHFCHSLIVPKMSLICWNLFWTVMCNMKMKTRRNMQNNIRIIFTHTTL